MNVDAFFELAGLAFKALGWFLTVFLVLSIGCAAIYVVVWCVLWQAVFG